MFNFFIRAAVPEDKNALLNIAHQYRSELGYVHPVALMEHIQRGTVYVAEWSGQVAGFVDFHTPQRAANKGYSVVYHIAVHRDFTRKDIGRALLYAVPCPIRLKCTQDNPANKFYEAAGMRLVGTETGKKRGLNVWEMRLLHILVRGDNRSVPDIAKKTGWAYGLRDDHRAYAWPFMIDINWQAYDWQKYTALIQAMRPVQAMVADYERSSQREIMLQQATDLRRLGVLRVLVCPKFTGAIDDIPRDCIIALSVPTKNKGKYKGWWPAPDELAKLAGRKIHLLGGSPRKQMQCITQLRGFGAVVISQDSSNQLDSRRVDTVFEAGTWKTLRQERPKLAERAMYSGQKIREWLDAGASEAQLSLFYHCYLKGGKYD